ncbi:MAG: TolC family protein, partial [Calditrichaeota bacterium]|nr:TolC family protein [Calditrichota bacterium]
QDRRQVQQAHMAERKLDLQRQQLTLDIRQQVTEAYELLDNARQQILLQQRLVLQERERYRITENQYHEGLVSNLDLSSAERTLSAAELLLQDYYIQWHRQRLQLSFATGTIGEDNG